MALIIGYVMTASGFLLFFGPLSVVSSLKGASDRNKHTCTRLVLGRTAIRVRAASTPGEGFEAVEPDLEDVYFTTMRSSA